MNNKLKPIDKILPENQIKKSSNHKNCKEKIQQIPPYFLSFVRSSTYIYSRPVQEKCDDQKDDLWYLPTWSIWKGIVFIDEEEELEWEKNHGVYAVEIEKYLEGESCERHFGLLCFLGCLEKH
jgi:hypothetical protein